MLLKLVGHELLNPIGLSSGEYPLITQIRPRNKQTALPLSRSHPGVVCRQLDIMCEYNLSDSDSRRALFPTPRRRRPRDVTQVERGVTGIEGGAAWSPVTDRAQLDTDPAAIKPLIRATALVLLQPPSARAEPFIRQGQVTR